MDQTNPGSPLLVLQGEGLGLYAHGGWVRTRIRVCSGKVSLWESWSPVCRAGRFHPGTVPHPVDPTGFHSGVGSRASGPPWGWVALPGLYQTLQSEESLCWTCGRGIRHYPGFVSFPWTSLLPKTRHSEPAVKAEAEPQSQGFWGVQEHSDDGESEGTRYLDRGAGGPQDLLLLNPWSHLLKKRKKESRIFWLVVIRPILVIY